MRLGHATAVAVFLLLVGCAESQIAAATERIDENDGLDGPGGLTLLVRPRLRLVDGSTHRILSPRTRLVAIDRWDDPRLPDRPKILWVSYSRSCTKPDCALGFLREDGGYALAIIPEGFEAYRGTATKAHQLHFTPGQPARTRAGKRVGLTCREAPGLNVIYRPGETRPTCPLRR